MITAEAGAFMIIDILYNKGIINDKTYENIKKKYRRPELQISRTLAFN